MAGIDGNPVYYDRTGEFKVPAMVAEGVTLEDVIYHCVFVTEYLYKNIFADIDTSRLILVFDLKSSNITDLNAMVGASPLPLVGFAFKSTKHS